MWMLFKDMALNVSSCGADTFVVEKLKLHNKSASIF